MGDRWISHLFIDTMHVLNPYQNNQYHKR